MGFRTCVDMLPRTVNARWERESEREIAGARLGLAGGARRCRGTARGGRDRGGADGPSSSAATRRFPIRTRYVAPGPPTPPPASHAIAYQPYLHTLHYSRYVTHQFNTKQPRGILHRAFSVFLFDEQVRCMVTGAWRMV